MKKRYWVYECSCSEKKLIELASTLTNKGYDFSIHVGNIVELAVFEEEADYAELIMIDKNIVHKMVDVIWRNR